MKVLLIVDMQKGFINEYNQHLVENINNLIKSYKFDKIIATKFVNKKDSQYIKLLNWNEMFSSPDIDFALDIPKNAIIIEKCSYGIPYDIFGLSDNITLKNSTNQIISKDDEIYICGTDYDACVLSIGFQLFDLGYTFYFVEKCIGNGYSYKNLNIELIKEIFKKNFGVDCFKNFNDLNKS